MEHHVAIYAFKCEVFQYFFFGYKSVSILIGNECGCLLSMNFVIN